MSMEGQRHFDNPETIRGPRCSCGSRSYLICRGHNAGKTKYSYKCVKYGHSFTKEMECSGLTWRAPGNSGAVWDLLRDQTCVGMVFSVGDEVYCAIKNVSDKNIRHVGGSYKSMKAAAEALVSGLTSD